MNRERLQEMKSESGMGHWLTKKRIFFYIVLFLLGVMMTGMVDMITQMKKKVDERQLTLNKISDAWMAIQIGVFKKGCRGSGEIAKQLTNIAPGQEKKLDKMARKLKPWKLYIIEDSMATLQGNGDVSRSRECSISLLALVERMRKKNLLIIVEKLKVFEKEKEKLCKLILIREIDKVLMATITPEKLIALSKIRDIRSRYLLAVYGPYDHGLLVGDIIPESPKTVNLTLGLSGVPLSMKLMPRPGVLKIKKVVNVRRLLIWGFGQALTLQLIFFLALLQKKNTNLEKSRQIIEEASRKLKELAIRDGLTGLFNRRHFDEHLDNEFRRTMRFGRSVSCVMADIDHFKEVNDTYGHQFGDVVLKGVAAILKDCVREAVDIVARYGGEEFVIILPETDTIGAAKLSERIRSEIARKQYTFDDNIIKVTASFGASTMQPSSEKHDQKERLVYEADQALYRAKETGRNRVCCFSEQSDV